MLWMLQSKCTKLNWISSPQDQQRDSGECAQKFSGMKDETGHDTRPHHSTLANLEKAQDSIRLSRFNANKGWLLDEEVDIVKYATDMAACGFPLTQKLLKGHVDEICTVWLGNTLLGIHYHKKASGKIGWKDF